MMASALTLAGMRLDPDVIETLGRRLRTMNILKDSSFYQVILKEGREEGWKEGLETGERKGEIKGARKLLFHLGRARLGRLDKTTRAAIEAIDDLERLERLSERLLTATSWADLLSEPN
jgi:predicted transposase YdaD